MFEFDGACLPQPPIHNALKEVAAVLTAAGHRVIPWRIDIARTLELLLQVFQSDASGDFTRQCALSGETVLENVKPPDHTFVAAPRHGDYTKVRYFAYTAVANVLDLPACTLPVGRVDPDIDLPDHPSLSQDAKGNDLPAVTCERDEIIRRKYTSEAYDGMPIGLQVVGRRMEEKKVVGIVREISQLLRRKTAEMHLGLAHNASSTFPL